MCHHVHYQAPHRLLASDRPTVNNATTEAPTLYRSQNLTLILDLTLTLTLDLHLTLILAPALGPNAALTLDSNSKHDPNS